MRLHICSQNFVDANVELSFKQSSLFKTSRTARSFVMKTCSFVNFFTGGTLFCINKVVFFDRWCFVRQIIDERQFVSLNCSVFELYLFAVSGHQINYVNTLEAQSYQTG